MAYCERCYGAYTREPSDPVDYIDDGLPWHTGPDVAAYVELNREWAMKWMKTESEKGALAGVLTLLVQASSWDEVMAAKANATVALKTMGGE